jgi:hypothetical protein
MTHPEVEKMALGLPDTDRAALVGSLIESLNEAGVAVLRKVLAAAEEVQMEALGSRLEAQIDEWFQGKGVEWTDERWQTLERGEGRAARVLRGGAFRYDRTSVRCVSRFMSHPELGNFDRGFRVCASSSP